MSTPTMTPVLTTEPEMTMAAPSIFPRMDVEEEARPTRQRAKKKYVIKAVKNLLLIPIFPFLGYTLLDQTGISQGLVTLGVIPEHLLGEGFGHVGLCFSIHYLATALQCLWKAYRFRC